MESKHKLLLVIDGLVNLLLGILLLLSPVGTIDFLGLPRTDIYFYPSILGAVIFGIGLALLFERFGHARQFQGLGLGGAILINLVGSLVLIAWLVSGALTLPLKGQIILWTVGVVVLFIGIAKLITRSWSYEK